MKVTYIIFIVSIILTSCSTENNNEDDNNLLGNTSNLLKRQYYNYPEIDGITIERSDVSYSYNENSRISKITDNFKRDKNGDIIYTETHNHSFVYDSKGNVIEWNKESYQSTFGSESTLNSYRYDMNNRLIFSSNNNDYNYYSYEGNMITVIDGNDGNDVRPTIYLEINDIGLVTKLTQPNYYCILSYDPNQNISEIEIYYKDGNLLFKKSYTYDNNPNPFYGQLSSTYISSFLKLMHGAKGASSGNSGTIGISLSHSLYDRERFPFLKNNIKSEYEFGLPYTNYFDFNYNNNGYPIIMTEFSGENDKIFNLEYFN